MSLTNKSSCVFNLQIVFLWMPISVERYQVYCGVINRKLDSIFLDPIKKQKRNHWADIFCSQWFRFSLAHNLIHWFPTFVFVLLLQLNDRFCWKQPKVVLFGFFDGRKIWFWWRNTDKLKSKACLCSFTYCDVNFGGIVWNISLKQSTFAKRYKAFCLPIGQPVKCKNRKWETLIQKTDWK